MRNFFLIFILILLFVPASGYSRENDDTEILRITPLPHSQQIRPGQELTLELSMDLGDGWHINSDQPNSDYMIPSRLELGKKGPFSLASVRYPDASEYEFDFAQEPVSVFEDGLVVRAGIKADPDIKPGAYEIPLKFQYQPCNEDTCLNPETAELALTVTVAGTPLLPEPAAATSVNGPDSYGTAAGPGGDNLTSRIESSGLLIGLFLVFLGGLALNLTPCVYPIIPITISYFGAQAEGRTSRLFMMGLVYVAGMAATYSAIGVVTALTGAVFGGLLQHPAVLIGVSVFFVLMALSMFGFYEFRLPRQWVDAAGGARTGLAGALLMGLTMGVIAAPCIGPLVLGLVAYVAALGDPVRGFFLFFFLALGLGTPYLFLALFSGKIQSLPSSGEWMEGVRHIFGLVLLGAAVYFVSPLLPEPMDSHALPVFGVISALLLVLFDKTARGVAWFKIFRFCFCAVLIGVSAYFLLPAETAGYDREEFSRATYEQALENNKKMVIVFHADWCIPCRELERQTLSDPGVAEQLEEFKVFGVDMTRGQDPETKNIDSFDVKGVPTVILIDSQGNRTDRIAGLIGAEDFKEKLSRIE
ncbi:MAG: protein-disulfide reductase DsbD family protein [Desulfobacterales bacterium]